MYPPLPVPVPGRFDDDKGKTSNSFSSSSGMVVVRVVLSLSEGGGSRAFGEKGSSSSVLVGWEGTTSSCSLDDDDSWTSVAWLSSGVVNGCFSSSGCCWAGDSMSTKEPLRELSGLSSRGLSSCSSVAGSCLFSFSSSPAQWSGDSTSDIVVLKESCRSGLPEEL